MEVLGMIPIFTALKPEARSAYRPLPADTAKRNCRWPGVKQPVYRSAVHEIAPAAVALRDQSTAPTVSSVERVPFQSPFPLSRAPLRGRPEATSESAGRPGHVGH